MGQLNFSKSEEEILKIWQEKKIFDLVQKKDAPQGNFVFFEGPPTANAAPGIHHVLARIFKDVILRYKTMCGYHIDRKAGWDTHGLPVELQVEKKLGISGKPQIENIVRGDTRASIIKFNVECRDMVWSNLSDWEKLTERIGFWLDTKNPYITYSNEYIESVWWQFKQIWEKDLVYKGYKVVPFCTRCGTTLSSHEVALGYKTVEDNSVYLKFKVKNAKAPNTYILSWTTTPWTLPGNVALAVHENIDYVYANIGDETWILAKNRTNILPEGFTIKKEIKGSNLVGLEYEPLFEISALQNDAAYKVYAADFVTDGEGTGVVHTAVMYGEDDYDLGLAVGLPQHHTVDENGKFTAEVPADLAGLYVKDSITEKKIIEYLALRNALFKEELYSHEYPFCWRCATPLLYYGRDSWFIRMSDLRKELLSRNNGVHWEPAHIKDGRFGEWLANVRDWAISRERYWGTPMPVWECECGETVCAGSHSEAGISPEVDLHRPFVDDVVFDCKKCGKKMQRVKEVLDVWFDSGAMPVAQWGFPHLENSEAFLTDHYPADYICEAVDQTRGWFYTLLAIATLLEKPAPYKNVICLGHILDGKGEKMSKSKGNIVQPWEVIEQYGVDALRFYLFTVSPAGEPKRFDIKGVENAMRRTLMILWNVTEFYTLYKDKGMHNGEAHILDSWIMSVAHETTREVTGALENYDVTRAGRALHECIDLLSTWFVRRSRERFKNGDSMAIATLRDVLIILSKLIAPFTPFLAEKIYVIVSGAKPSVHLEDWPRYDEKQIDIELLQIMKEAREIVEVGLALRAKAGVKVRQPLASFAIRETKFNMAMLQILKDELNVKEIIVEAPAGDGWINDESKNFYLMTELTDELKKEGLVREVIRAINALRKDAKLTLDDRIVIFYSGDKKMTEIIETASDEIKNATLADAMKIEKHIDGERIANDFGELCIKISKI